MIFAEIDGALITVLDGRLNLQSGVVPKSNVCSVAVLLVILILACQIICGM